MKQFPSTSDGKFITWPLTALWPPLGRMTIFMKTVAFDIRHSSEVFNSLNAKGTLATFILLNWDAAGIFFCCNNLLHLLQNHSCPTLSSTILPLQVILEIKAVLLLVVSAFRFLAFLLEDEEEKELIYFSMWTFL